MRMTEEEILLTLEGRNGWEFNHLKTLEELAELTEALIKKITKNGSAKEPTDRHICEEIAHVKLRCRILEYLYGTTEVREEELKKLAKWEEYITTNKYTHI
jgi:hypothetical protein